MRVATSTVYQETTANIDQLYATYSQQGEELSTGKSFNVPSDNPTIVAQDLYVRNANAVNTQIGANLTDLNNQLTTVDGALSTLTNIVTSARSLAIEAASNAINSSQQSEIGTQVDQLLQEAIGVANTQYGGKYVFTGTAVAGSPPPVQANGSPTSSVTAVSNTVQNVEELPNGQKINTGVTLQQAFNVNSSNGSPSVFQTLITLRDALNNQSVVDESSQNVNLPGTYVNSTAAASPPGTTLDQLVTGAVPQILATPLKTDSTGQISISVSNAQAPNGVTVTLPAGPPAAGPYPTVNAALLTLNTALNPIGISAAFNQQTQRFSLTSTSNPPQTFQVSDVPSPGATNASNFVEAFGLVNQATTVSYVSTQLGDVDNALQTLLNGRAVVGSTIQTVQAVNNTANQQVVNGTAVQSSLEDTDIPQVTSAFQQTQTVLQAAYATTTRLESKTLFDYL
jgi:flagellar hook-associated protein 3 FlgL